MGSIPKFVSKLRMWGKAGVVKEQTKITPKIGDCVLTCMSVGYNQNSGDNIYRMRNPDTTKINNTRDIICLKRMFYQNKFTIVMVAYMTQFDESNIN